MIDDLLRPCEDADCGMIGDYVCEICGEAYCEDHIDEHECEELA